MNLDDKFWLKINQHEIPDEKLSIHVAFCRELERFSECQAQEFSLGCFLVKYLSPNWSQFNFDENPTSCLFRMGRKLQNQNHSRFHLSGSLFIGLGRWVSVETVFVVLWKFPCEAPQQIQPLWAKLCDREDSQLVWTGKSFTPIWNPIFTLMWRNPGRERPEVT